MNKNFPVIKLLRLDEPMKSSNESVDSVTLNNTIEAGGINQTTKVKRNTRLSRKRTFKDKSVIEDVDQVDDIKRRKHMVKNSHSINTESVSRIVPQKNTKKPKSPIPTQVKLTENSSTASDFNQMSSTISSSVHVNNETTVSMVSPLKTSQNRKTKYVNSNKKNIINNVDEDNVSYKNGKNEKSVPLKSPKNKISQSSISTKKNPMHNVSKDRMSKEDLLNDNSVPLKLNKNKSSKSLAAKKSLVVNNTNHSNVSIDFKECINSTSPKIPKNKSSTKKRPLVNNIKKNDIHSEVEEKSDAVIPKKLSRSTLKKGQLPNSNVDNGCNNVIDSKLIANTVVVLDKIHVPKPEVSKESSDNMMMLRSNNKPPKIKKKWSEEWSGDKLLNNVLKTNNDDHLSSPKVDVDNCSKMIKKVMKTPKSKNTNYKKVKTKMLEKLNTNTDSFLIKNQNTISHLDLSSSNILGTQNQDPLLIANITPLAESTAASDNVITDTNTIIPDVPLICDQTNRIMTTSSSEVVIEPTASTQLSMPSIETPPTSTEPLNNTVSYENNQPSHLITPESTFDPGYSSFPMRFSESTEISYGIAILSEAISRQCRESNEESIKTKSPEHDLNEIQSSPKKANSILPSQVLSGTESSQKVNEPKTESKKVVKYSTELGESSVQTKSDNRAEREILLLSKRFNVPIESLRKTVIEEPLSVFHKKYSDSITPSMITISPIVKYVETKIEPKTDYLKGTLDVEYKLEPIRESAAYEKTNLKDLMQELVKTMPSWSLSVVTNPSRYVISQMSINTYGVPNSNKAIVLDRFFRASVYINQSLEHTYCKPYTTATEIVNLIKELNSL